MKLKDLKNRSFKLYQQLRSDKIICPALKEEVKFTLMGWNHLVRPKNKSRRPQDLYRRLKLLPFVKSILEKSHTIQNIRSQNNKVFYAFESIEDIETLRKIRVLVMDSKTGKKFYSVMDKKSS